MKSYQIGAVLYALWGIVHVIGGLNLFTVWMRDGGAGIVDVMVGREFSTSVAPLLSGVAGYHFFNITWFGLLVTTVAVTLNWKNSRVGFWVNLAIVGFADLGLVLFMLLPGYISWAEGLIGIGLFVPAAVCSLIGVSGPGRNALRDMETAPA